MADKPDVVRRRAAIELTEEVREKLENQGIPRHQQHDDLSVAKKRYTMDRRFTLHGVEIGQPGGERLTKESVHKHIATIMNNCSDTGGGQYQDTHIHTSVSQHTLYIWKL